jgi:hypothetical protein
MLIRTGLAISHFNLIALSPFDADAFMGQSVDTALDTKRPIVPAGDYRATIGEFNAENGFRSFVSEKEGKNYGREFTMFMPPFVLADDPRLAEYLQLTGLERATVSHRGMFLDLVDNGQGGQTLDKTKGKNVDLGQLREAVGQNAEGQPWSFSQLIGAGPVMVKVVHEPDKNNAELKYARVGRVVKIS